MIEVESDKISCLPDHLIDQILSYLSIKEAVRTSVLSSKWRKKWSTLPNLEFDRRCVSTVTSQDPSVMKSKFLRIIDHVLLLHSGPINKFKVSDSFCHLTIGVNSTADIDRWMFHISERHIKKLVLDIRSQEHYKIPWCLFSCQSLHHLELNYCWLKPPTTFEGFRYLKSLSMTQVTMTQDAFENFISGCPLLEELKLTEIDGLRLKPPMFGGFRNLKSLSMTGVTMTQDDFENIISCCPRLEKLKLTEIDGLTQINIHVPNLKIFYIDDEFESINFDDTLKLATVSVYFKTKSIQNGLHGCSSDLLKFFVHLPKIQRLETNNKFLKYWAAGIVPVKLPTPCINLRSLCLSINFNDLKKISVVLCLLNSSPNLRNLEMFAQNEKENDLLAPVSCCWEDIFSESTIPFGVQHVWIGEISGTKFELDFVKFLLLHSPVLEKMSEMPVSNVKTEVMTELIRLKSASKQVEVIYHEKDFF